MSEHFALQERTLTPEGVEQLERLLAEPSKCTIVPKDVPVYVPPADNAANLHCARCGELDRHFVTIEDKDFCEPCAAIVRLNEFHRLVTGEQPQ